MRTLVAVLGLTVVFGVLSAPSQTCAQIVALGASNTYGRGVDRDQAYPVHLERILRSRGLNLTIKNAGINGDTTSGMLARLDSTVPPGTRLVILQPGGNDARATRKKSKSVEAPDTAGNIRQIADRLQARGIKLIVTGTPEQRDAAGPYAMGCGNFGQGAGPENRAPDGEHFTPEGYRRIAERIASCVQRALQRR